MLLAEQAPAKDVKQWCSAIYAFLIALYTSVLIIVLYLCACISAHIRLSRIC